MQQIFLDEFTNNIAVGCDEENAIIDYFATVEEAREKYPKAIVEDGLDIMEVSVSDCVVIKLINQKIILSKDQAITLRGILSSL